MNKKIFFTFALVFLVSFKIFSQYQKNRILAEEYLRQSERQKKTGLIMLGAGVGATVAGTVMFFAAWGGASAAVGTTGVILFATGSVSTLASVPIIISSASNGRRAGKLSVSSEKSDLSQTLGKGAKFYPALNFSYPIYSRKK
jgi:hypothetical protein